MSKYDIKLKIKVIKEYEKNIFENLNTIKELEEFKKKLLTIKKD